MTDVAVLGAGSWGTTLADLLARKGLSVKLWAYEPEVADSINARHENDLFMPGEALAPALVASNDLATVVSGAPMICSVVPSHATRGVLSQVAGLVPKGTRLVSATKGIEPDTLQLMGEVAAEAIPHATFVALSGPSFAEEVFHGQPSAVVAASHDRAASVETQRVFATPAFRIYSNDDVTGVTPAQYSRTASPSPRGFSRALASGTMRARH